MWPALMEAPRSSPIAASVTTKIKHDARFVRQCLPSTFLPNSPTLIQTPLGLLCSWANSTLAYTWATHMVRWAEHPAFPAIRIGLAPLLGKYSNKIVHWHLCWLRVVMKDVFVHIWYLLHRSSYCINVIIEHRKVHWNSCWQRQWGADFFLLPIGGQYWDSDTY